VAAPFWVTARFNADRTQALPMVSGWEHLCSRLDGMRPSGNLFAALRIRGVFDLVHARVACKARPGASLVEATSSQSEFRWTEVAGTLVGFWTPEWARTINVPGFHLHFLRADLSGDPAAALAKAEGGTASRRA
jgi:acetolactate decarboxylase